MKVGISTACLYPELLEKGLEKLLKLGFRHFEFFFNTFRELEPTYVKGLARMLNEYGATARSVHPFTSGYESLLLFSGYERRFEDTVEFYKHYFEAASLLGAQLLVLHGQRIEKVSDMTEESYFSHYHRLLEAGRTFGVTTAQENVNLFRSSQPDFLRHMRAYLQNDCAFVLDVKQSVRAGFSPFETCAAMGEQLVHVHINDNRPGQSCLLPGRGTMDYAKLMRQLAVQHFSGDCMIEVYRSSFGAESELVEAREVVECYQRLFQKQTQADGKTVAKNSESMI
ncbi:MULTISPECIES: sugar phosphate isomerase/epimerase family protein [Caproicibacterium]|uniref:Sugar phosphate isomerase/epimerase n=1 Tax=Caproicibacterium argilliputei TaxID=3030016 RepID=A0AA97H3T3_9FIRM|nr:sugar phosphate isomerase/epimerase [Caproicibacterium argilliputei]WOC33542.1 sugar phosphate isomerase/epimerase [Caproicibacterium argilliputei]